MLVDGAGGSRLVAAGAAVLCLALAVSGCGSASPPLRTTKPSGSRTVHTEKAKVPGARRSGGTYPPTGPSPEIERARKALEKQITPALEGQGATPAQVSCIVRQIEALPDLRFQVIVSSPQKSRAAMRSMEARCGG